MSLSNLAIGVDVGGTHITAALIDLSERKILTASTKRATVNADGTEDEIVRAWTACIVEAKGDSDIESICIAMPGPFNYESGVCLMKGQAKYESLHGLNIKELLASSLQVSPASIFMENDAACFLQGEVFSGVAREHDDKTVIGITLGTGLGSAVYRNGKSYNADMWCFPFKDSIAEEYLSTRWFVKRWNEKTGTSIKGVKELVTLIAADNNAQEIFQEFSHQLSLFITAFIEKESPAAAIIGGNIANAFNWFGPSLQQAISAQYPSIKILPATLGEEAPLLGAVGSWWQQRTSILSLS